MRGLGVALLVVVAGAGLSATKAPFLGPADLPPETGESRPRVVRETGLPYRKVFVPGLIRVRFFPWVAPDPAERLLLSLGLSVVSREPAHGLYVVRTPDREKVGEVVVALNRSPLVEWAVPHYVLVRIVPPPRPIEPLR